jgi:hypothetical protein
MQLKFCVVAEPVIPLFCVNVNWMLLCLELHAQCAIPP